MTRAKLFTHQLTAATERDAPFIRSMLFVAAVPENIPEEFRPTVEGLMRHKWFSRYIDNWGRPGDTGTIASVNRQPVGAAWFRNYTPGEQSTLRKFKSAMPPHELAIGVEAEYRGQGIG